MEDKSKESFGDSVTNRFGAIKQFIEAKRSHVKEKVENRKKLVLKKMINK